MGGEKQAIAVERGRIAAESLIQWWQEAGVDVAVGEQPRGWLRGSNTVPQAPVPNHSEIEKARDLAGFQAWLATAPGLPMDRPGAIRVAPQGVEGAKVMLLTDLPDRGDGSGNIPIGGDCWELTQRMLAAISISASEAYIASLSPFHAPGARFNGELEACAAIARDHIRLAKPDRLILLGDAPSRALLGEPMVRARGRIHRIEGVRAIATFHPRMLLQRPSDKALAWRDLLLLMSESD